MSWVSLSLLSPSLNLTVIQTLCHQFVDAILYVFPMDSACQPEEQCTRVNHSIQDNPTQSAPTTVEAVRLAISEWQFNWGPEGSWEKHCNDRLRLHQEQESACRAVDDFFSSCETHAQAGQDILGDLRNLVLAYCRSRRAQKDRFPQLYEMLEVVLSEVRFLKSNLMSTHHRYLIQDFLLCSTMNHLIKLN